MTEYLYYVVISQPRCDSCKKATDLLTEKGITHTKIDTYALGWVRTLVKQAGLTTVPQIYDYYGNYVGGFEDLQKHLKGTTYAS